MKRKQANFHKVSVAIRRKFHIYNSLLLALGYLPSDIISSEKQILFREFSLSKNCEFSGTDYVQYNRINAHLFNILAA